MKTIDNSELYEARAEVASAFSHPLRLKIIDLLAEEGEMCVYEFTDCLDASQSSISKHLKILRQAGILERKSQGLKNYYALRVPCTVNFFDCLDQVLQEDYKKKRDSLDLV